MGMDNGGGRKILPRLLPYGAADDGPSRTGLAESSHKRPKSELINGDGNGVGSLSTAWQSAEIGAHSKRKRPLFEESNLTTASQTLPSVRQLLTSPAPAQYAVEHGRTVQARLVTANDGSYAHQGAFNFLAPPLSKEFPTSISSDNRELSFAMVEPELMTAFKLAWRLRHHIRKRNQRGEVWLDQVFMNDSYGIGSILSSWTSRYDPGTIQYPLGHLYKHTLWLYFHRTIQHSPQRHPSFMQVVTDGWHYHNTVVSRLENADRSFLLIPMFLLGTTAQSAQHDQICAALQGLTPFCGAGTVMHATTSLQRVWDTPESAYTGGSWNWERLQAPESSAPVTDRSLVDLLWDPLAPPTTYVHVRSPESYQTFEAGRFRAAPAAAPGPAQPRLPTLAPATSRMSRAEADPSSSRRSASLPRQHSSNPTSSSEGVRGGGGIHLKQQSLSLPNYNRQNSFSSPQPFLAPPPPSLPQSIFSPRPHVPPVRASTPGRSQSHPDEEMSTLIIQPKTKSSGKSSVAPCMECGKVLKNPSDAQSVAHCYHMHKWPDGVASTLPNNPLLSTQPLAGASPQTATTVAPLTDGHRKHALQHTKPFRCSEPGCTRVQGFGTYNDLQRHRKSVHNATSDTGSQVGYMCAACPPASFGSGSSGVEGGAMLNDKKWWPRLDNFKAHLRRRHAGLNEEDLLQASLVQKTILDDVYSESAYGSSSTMSQALDSQMQLEDDEESRVDRESQSQSQSFSSSFVSNDSFGDRDGGEDMNSFVLSNPPYFRKSLPPESSREKRSSTPEDQVMEERSAEATPKARSHRGGSPSAPVVDAEERDINGKANLNAKANGIVKEEASAEGDSMDVEVQGDAVVPAKVNGHEK